MSSKTTILAVIATLFLYSLFGGRYSGRQNSDPEKGSFSLSVGGKLEIEQTSFEALKEDPVTVSLRTGNLTHDNRQGQDGPHKLENPGKDPSNGESAALLKYFKNTVIFQCNR